MKRVSYKRHLLICLISIWVGPVNADLRVNVYDQNNDPVDNAVVSVYPTDPAASSILSNQTSMTVMDQRNKQFIPYVLPVRTGTSVSFPNSDNIRHQVYSFSPTKVFKLPLYHDTPTEPVIFNTPGVVVLGCNIHDQMIAYIYVVDTDAFAMVEQGRALISDMGTGQYEVRLWHPSLVDTENIHKLIEVKDEKDSSSLDFNVLLKTTKDNSSTLTPLEQQFKALLRETN